MTENNDDNDKEPQYNLLFSFEEINLLKEVIDYEIDDVHETMATTNLSGSERKDWRIYLHELIHLGDKLGSAEKQDNSHHVPKEKPIMVEEPTTAFDPNFLEID